MKNTYAYVLLVGATLLVGCAETHRLMLDTTVRPPTQSVEVYNDGSQPTRQVKQIAELSYKAKAAEQLKVQEYFINQARKLGGNAVQMSKEPAGEHVDFGLLIATGGAFGGVSKDIQYLFRGKVLIYE